MFTYVVPFVCQTASQLWAPLWTAASDHVLINVYCSSLRAFRVAPAMVISSWFGALRWTETHLPPCSQIFPNLFCSFLNFSATLAECPPSIFDMAGCRVHLKLPFTPRDHCRRPAQLINVAPAACASYLFSLTGRALKHQRGWPLHRFIASTHLAVRTLKECTCSAVYGGRDASASASPPLSSPHIHVAGPINNDRKVEKSPHQGLWDWIWCFWRLTCRKRWVWMVSYSQQ